MGAGRSNEADPGALFRALESDVADKEDDSGIHLGAMADCGHSSAGLYRYWLVVAFFNFNPAIPLNGTSYAYPISKLPYGNYNYSRKTIKTFQVQKDI